MLTDRQTNNDENITFLAEVTKVAEFWQDLPAIVDVVAGCIVPVSAYDMSVEVFNGVTVGGVAVVVAVVTPEPAKQAST